jgi:hypothetical protein
MSSAVESILVLSRAFIEEPEALAPSMMLLTYAATWLQVEVALKSWKGLSVRRNAPELQIPPVETPPVMIFCPFLFCQKPIVSAPVVVLPMFRDGKADSELALHCKYINENRATAPLLLLS